MRIFPELVCMLLSPFLVHLFQMFQVEFQSPEEKIIYDHMIIAFVRIFEDQITGFNNSQEEILTFVFIQSRFKNSLSFSRRGYKV